jgi:hypothetical protein
VLEVLPWTVRGRSAKRVIWEKVCSVLMDIEVDGAKTEAWLLKKTQFGVS